jgi:lysophospholipase L1-like esterase
MSNKLIRENLQPLKSKREIVLLVFGDSVSTGSGLGGNRDFYGAILKQKIGDLFGRPVSLINSSREDESYTFAPRRIQADIQSYRPDITFIMLGLVDALMPNMLSTDHLRHLEHVFTPLRESNTFVIVLTTTGLRDVAGKDDPQYLKLTEFNQYVRETAQYYHFPVIDVFRHMEEYRLSNPGEYFNLFDGTFRLSEKGHAFIADLIYQNIENNFEEKPE